MNEITAAIIGAFATAFLMAVANITNRGDRDTREIFRRLGKIETELARQTKRGRFR